MFRRTLLPLAEVGAKDVEEICGSFALPRILRHAAEHGRFNNGITPADRVVTDGTLSAGGEAGITLLGLFPDWRITAHSRA